MAQTYSPEDLRLLIAKLDPLLLAMAEEGAAIARQDRQPPRELYHYTDSAAFQGIVENSELWATDTRFLNDTSELQWASHVVKNAIDRRTPNSDDEAELITRLKATFGQDESLTSVYIASFSENNDDLTQWRGYGTGVGPLCIGFHPNKLAFKLREHELLSVIYDEQEQERIAQALIDKIVSFYNLHRSDGNPAVSTFLIPMCLRAFRAMAAYAVLRFKQPHWHSEREWRMVAVKQDYDDISGISFRVGARGLIPFLKMKGEENPFDFHRTMEIVTVGPTPDRELAARSVYMYAKSKEVGLREVATSKITLR